jgi:hypothetical protein
MLFPRPVRAIGAPVLAVAWRLALGLALAASAWGLTRSTARGTPGGRLLAAVGHRPRPGHATVVLLFGSAECPKRMELVELLNRLHDRGVGVEGLLMVDPHNFPGWRDLIHANGIAFPVRPIPLRTGSAIATAVGYHRTPVVVVYDSLARMELATDLPEQGALAAFLESLH